MQTVELRVTKRNASTKPNALRREGRLPAVVYGAGAANEALSLDAHEFRKSGLGSAGAHLIKFQSEDPALNGSVALVKSVQTHPVAGYPLHVDFLRLDLTKPVQTPVSVSYVGKPIGVTAGGGILQPIRRDIEVRALPDKLPEVIEVDVSALEIHDAIHVAELVMPEGVEAIYSDNFTLVTVVAPVVEKVEAPPVEEGAEVVAAEGAEPEGEEAEPAAGSE